MTKTNTPAARIRRNLKAELNLTSRQVSVRSSSGSVDITIKAAGIKTADVKAIAQREERISYDAHTQCILRGGNTFVFVTLADDLLEGPAAEVLPWIQSLPTGSSIHSVPDAAPLGVSRENEWSFGLWGDGPGRICGDNAHGIARQIAARQVEAA